MHGEQVAIYPKNILRMAHSMAGLIALTGLLIKNRHLLKALLVYGLLGAIPSIIIYLFQFNLPITPWMVFSGTIYLGMLVIFYGGSIYGYSLIKNKF